MKLSKYYIPTIKENPSEAEVISHQLMIRSGMIKKLSTGIYTWLPLGLKVCMKVENIIREEMNNIGALELEMPSVQPSELWQQSGRWDEYGTELLRFKDRHNRDYCIGPTHEEVMTDIIKGFIASYKQLPITFYQIQKKFRDEVRPRFGVMRGREFLMKDAYSFHSDENSLQKTYNDMNKAYHNIFNRIGLNFRAVVADSGSIGGNDSHEFHVLADTGEDYIAFSSDGNFAANIEKAECTIPKTPYFKNIETLEKIYTPDCKTITNVCDFFKSDIKKTIKTLVVEGNNDELVALCLRGDHTLNELKVEKIEEIRSPIKMVSSEKIKEVLGCDIGSIGPKDFKGKVIVDYSCSIEQSMICGANEDSHHYIGLNWNRDITKNIKTADLRNIENGDQSPDGGIISIVKGIEVGHIFQLSDKYTLPMGISILNDIGKSITPKMGCYGIGITRTIAAAIEQNNDKNGIIWAETIAPFTVAIAPIGYNKSENVTKIANSIYKELLMLGIDVCLDDRGKRPGIMFSELDLIGIPHRIIIGDRSIANNKVEYKGRSDSNTVNITIDEVVKFISNKLKLIK